MSYFTKSLFRLTVVTFVFAMLVPVSTTRAGPPINGCHPHKGPCGDDPVVDASNYTVTFSGNLTSVDDVHDSWSVSTSGHRSIDHQSHLFDMTLDLTFFTSMVNGDTCFDNDLAHPQTVATIDVRAAGITKRNIKGGAKQAVGMFWFDGFNATDQPLTYLLELFGTFANHDLWPSTQDLTMTEWEITTASGAGNAAEGACIGEGPFDDPNTEPMSEVKIVVVSHADAVHP